MTDGQNRSEIYPGLEVDVILKKDQPTGKLTRGIVKQILTSKPEHTRGVKVRLESGEVGRVQHVYGSQPARAQEPEEPDALGDLIFWN